jgi:pimeloyl-ACP methyl ester carboxylesterase
MIILPRIGMGFFVVIATCALSAFSLSAPKPIGKLVDLGGHRLHVHCTGNGDPTIVVENGLGDFSFDWSLVQSSVSAFARICTYDRAGYAWSDPGPKPRTFAQLSLELHDALSILGESGPFVVVGHSYGGPAVRNFALTYPKEVAGIVFVDSAFEGQRVGIGGKATMRLGEDAKGRPIPPPHENISPSDQPVIPAEIAEQIRQMAAHLDPIYDVLSPSEQQLQLWAQAQLAMYDAENSQREWSSETFALWLSRPQAGSLGSVPVMVLTRAEGGYRDGDIDIPAAQMEKERKDGQAMLASLSSNSKQIFIESGHNMELESPQSVAAAIQKMVEVVRSHRHL